MLRAGCAVVVWACLLPAFAPAAGNDDLLPWAKKSQGRFFYGKYVAGKKTGWVIDEVKLGKYAGKDVLLSTTESYTRVKFDGVENVSLEKVTLAYSLEGVGPIVHAEVYKKEDGKVLAREAFRQGKRLRIVTKQDGRTLTRTVDLPKDTLQAQLKLEAWLRAPRKAGDTFTKHSVNWDDAEVDDKEIYTFVGKKNLLIDGTITPAFAVEISVNGGKMKADVLPDGRPVYGLVGGIESIRLEKEAVARTMGPVVDLLDAASVFLDRDLGPARNVDALVLELTGLGDFKMPASHRQAIKPGKDSVRLELRRDFRVKEALPLTKEETARYTGTSPRLQCDEKSIIEQAKKIVGDEKDPFRAGRRIEAWVFKTLKKAYDSNSDTALQVLDHKAGACQEHALLFVSLARAAGVPAREVGGLAYVKAGQQAKPLFGWHAWAEFHDGRQWVSVDPTWHQVFVDGTHIKLSEGSRDQAWANIVGKLKVKVIDVQTRKKAKKPAAKANPR
jgi:hypothetical protein